MRLGRVMAGMTLTLLAWGDDACQEEIAEAEKEKPWNDFSRCTSQAMLDELQRRGMLPSNDPDGDDAEILSNMPIAALETEIQNRGYHILGEDE